MPPKSALKKSKIAQASVDELAKKKPGVVINENAIVPSFKIGPPVSTGSSLPPSLARLRGAGPMDPRAAAQDAKL